MAKFITVKKDFALEKAREYCKQKGYNASILDKLDFSKGAPSSAFVKYKELDFEPDLTTDMESMPYGFLIVESDGTVSECRDTHLFLEGKIEL